MTVHMHVFSLGTSAPWTGQIIVTEEEPAGKNVTVLDFIFVSFLFFFLLLTWGLWPFKLTFWPLEGVVPGKPRELQVTEATKNYVVLSWKPPGERGLEGVMYYVEKVNSDTVV